MKRREFLRYVAMLGAVVPLRRCVRVRPVAAASVTLAPLRNVRAGIPAPPRHKACLPRCLPMGLAPSSAQIQQVYLPLVTKESVPFTTP